MPAALGTAIPIYSTGYGTTPGQQDLNYTLTLNPLSNASAAFVAAGATVTELPSTGAPQIGWPVSGAWANDPNGQWIGPQSDVVAIAGTGMDEEFVYTTSFDLTGLDPSTAHLSGFWTADNYITSVQLNGQTVSTSGATSTSCVAPAPNTGFYFQNLYPFSITGGFRDGVNTLSFSVTNSNCHNQPPQTNPSGLFVDISGTAEPSSGPLGGVPEPGTLISTALGLGFALLGIGARKTRRAVSVEVTEKP